MQGNESTRTFWSNVLAHQITENRVGGWQPQKQVTALKYNLCFIRVTKSVGNMVSQWDLFIQKLWCWKCLRYVHQYGLSFQNGEDLQHGKYI